MATNGAKLTRRRALAFKVETTTGAQESLTASDAALDAIEPEIMFDDDSTERESASLSPRSRIPGAQSGTVEFRTYLAGAGITGTPALVDLLTCCGLKNTAGVLTPLTDTDVGNTGTFGLYKHGIFRSLFGVMLDVTFAGERGKPVECRFSGRGKRATGNTHGPRDLAMITPSYQSVIPPVLKGVTFTLGGNSYCIPGFELAFGNDVQLRECIQDATGYKAAQVVSHQRRLTITPEAAALSTIDWYEVYEQGTELALNIVIGSEAHNTITIAAPKLQLAQPPGDEDANGFFRHNLVFQFNMDSTGDDEISITFS